MEKQNFLDCLVERILQSITSMHSCSYKAKILVTNEHTYSSPILTCFFYSSLRVHAVAPSEGAYQTARGRPHNALDVYRLCRQPALPYLPTRGAP